MAETIRNFSIYGKSGRKLGFATGGSFQIMNNGEQQIGDGQWLGKSKGVPTCTLSCDTIITVGGSSATQALADAVLNQETLAMSVGIIDGRLYEADMTADDCKFDTDMAAGTLKGAFSFSGGKPTKVG